MEGDWRETVQNAKPHIVFASSELYQISLTRCREKLALMQSRGRSGEWKITSGRMHAEQNKLMRVYIALLMNTFL